MTVMQKGLPGVGAPGWFVGLTQHSEPYVLYWWAGRKGGSPCWMALGFEQDEVDGRRPLLVACVDDKADFIAQHFSVTGLLIDPPNLARTALVESDTVRRAPVFHVQAGGPDWVPTEKDMQAVMDLVNAALCDPAGSTLVTRSDVSVHQITGERLDAPITHVAIGPNDIAVTAHGDPGFTLVEMRKIADFVIHLREQRGSEKS